MTTATPAPSVTPPCGPDSSAGDLAFVSEQLRADIKGVKVRAESRSYGAPPKDIYILTLGENSRRWVSIGNAYTVCYQQKKVLATLAEAARSSRLKPFSQDEWATIARIILNEATGG